MKRPSLNLALLAGLLCALVAAAGCARKSSRAKQDAGAASSHAVTSTTPALTDAGVASEGIIVSGPAIRSAENCPPSDPVLAPYRKAGRGRLIARGRGFDYDVADAPMVCGELHTSTKRAFPSGRGTLWSVCASALRVRVHSQATLRGVVALNASAQGGARVEISAVVGKRVYELDEGAPATLEVDPASQRHTFKARMRRVDSPVEKFELSVEGRCPQ